MYKESWQYKRVKELGYKVKITKTNVTIYFDDGDIYASFKLVKDIENEKKYNIGYFIFLNNELINDEVDFYNTYDEAITSCLYYFLTRF